MKLYKVIVLLSVAAILLGSCGMQNKFASSFGKRRYTKGFYLNLPGNTQYTAANKEESGHAAIKIACIKTIQHPTVLPQVTTEAVIKAAVKITSAKHIISHAPLKKNVLVLAPPSLKAIASHHDEPATNTGSDKYLLIAACCFCFPIVATFISLELHLFVGYVNPTAPLLILLVCEIATLIFCIKSVEAKESGTIIAILLAALSLLITAIIILAFSEGA